MGSFKKYNTVRDFENATTVIKIEYPGIGDTGETITIRSRFSKVFRDAQAKAQRQIAAMAMANKGKELADDVVKEIEDAQFAALISDWSFDEELTLENITEFLDANPQIYDKINSSAANDTLFLKKNDKK